MSTYSKVYTFCTFLGLVYLIIATGRIFYEAHPAAAWDDRVFRLGVVCMLLAVLVIVVGAVVPKGRGLIQVSLILLFAAALIQSYDDDLYRKQDHKDEEASFVKQLEDRYGVKIAGQQDEKNFCISGDYLLIAQSFDNSASREPQTILVYSKEKKLVAEHPVDRLVMQLKESAYPNVELGIKRFYVQPATPRNPGFMQIALYAKSSGNVTRILYYNPVADANGDLTLKRTD